MRSTLWSVDVAVLVTGGKQVVSVRNFPRGAAPLGFPDARAVAARRRCSEPSDKRGVTASWDKRVSDLEVDPARPDEY